MFSIRIKYLFFTVGVLLILNACTKDVSIPIEPYNSKLSIQCLITPGKTPVAYVYRTVPFFDSNVLPVDLFARDAVVTLTSPDGSETLQPDSAFNDVLCYYEYFYAGQSPVQSNKTYSLSILYNGESYSASTTTDRRVVQLDSVTYTPQFKDLYGEHEGIILNFKDPAGKGDYYRFDMGRTFGPLDTIFGVGKVISECSLGKTTWVQELGRSIYADQNGDGTSFTITVEPTYKHKEGQVGYVRLQSMDKATFDFYDQFDRQKIAQTNPFVEPVFIQPGQFGTKAFGVFGAYVVSDSVKFVYPE
ncbi:MAG: DUF4249 domain-containing protein [Saprospiraceae bacterium]